jgi:hypothetical protein
MTVTIESEPTGNKLSPCGRPERRSDYCCGRRLGTAADDGAWPVA